MAADITVNTGDKTTTVAVAVAEVDIVLGQGGTAAFTSKNAHYLSKGGEPQIPWQTFTILLPPLADLSTISCQLDSVEYENLGNGGYVSPSLPGTGWDTDGNETILWPEGKTIVDGQDIDIYSANALWPSEAVQVLGRGQLHRWRLVEIAVPLLRYNPVTKELQRLLQAEMTVDYDYVSEVTEVGHSDRGRDRVSEIAVNFAEASNDYEMPLRMKSLSTGTNGDGYAIITTDAIVDASTKLEAFRQHKVAMGFNAVIYTESDWGGGTGDAAAENLRAWLKNNYISKNIKYVLLVGDPRPLTGDVPMKNFNFDSCDTGTCGEYDLLPTDYYYSELTGDWDFDDDGNYGEREDDAGGMDHFWEVIVGRIPYYGVVDDLDGILQKTIDYETSTDTKWRRNFLLPMVPMNHYTPSSDVGEQIKEEILDPEMLPSTRIYEQDYGIVPPPEVTPNSYEKTVETWTGNRFGCVISITHGSAAQAVYTIHVDQVPKLNNSYPSSWFQGSCETAVPEETNNLMYAGLKNGCINTIGATRIAYGSGYISDYAAAIGKAGIGQLAYRYTKEITGQKSCGEAMADTKQYLVVPAGHWGWRNHFIFTVHGDPSVRIIPDPLDFVITPTDYFHSKRELGQTDSLQSRTYTLLNNGSTELTWNAGKSASWFDVSPNSGSIPAEGSVDVTVTLNSQVGDLLTLGDHTDTITFADTTNDITIPCDVVCEIIPADPMLLYLPLDETSKTRVTDFSPYANHGLLKEDITFDANSVAGKFGSAINLSGNGDCVDIGSLNAEAKTIMLWVNFPSQITNTTEKQTLLRYSHNNDQHVIGLGSTSSLATNETLTIMGETRESGAFVYETTYIRDTISAGWHHLAFVWDESNSQYRILIDGAEKTTYGASNGRHASRMQVSNLVLGYSEDSSYASFTGAMDEVRVYRTALSNADILALKSGGDKATSPQPIDERFDASTVTPLKWAVPAAAAESYVYLGTNYNAVANANTNSSEYKGSYNQSTYFPDSELASNTEYFWRIDTTASGGVTKGAVWRFTTGKRHHGLLREVWRDIDWGTGVDTLTNDINYPDFPTLTETIPTFEAPGEKDKYGQRIHGYLVPPSDGNYTFWIASDDRSELWLSTGADPNNATLIAKVSIDATAPYEWDKYTEQESSAITLAAGKHYYIMALHKQHAKINHMEVAWSGPGISRQIIKGANLLPYTSGTAYDITPPSPPSNLVATTGDSEVALDWDNDDEVTYNVYRSTTSGSFTDAIVTGLTTNHYTDTAAVNDTTYYYVLTAVDSHDNESAQSAEVSGKPGYDSDTDGLPTAWEIANGLDPFDDGSTNNNNGASGNQDGDSYSNLDEFVLGLNPSLSDRIAIEIDPADMEVDFTVPVASGVGYEGLTRSYRLEHSSDFINWTTVTAAVSSGTLEVYKIPSSFQRGFYRLVITLE